MKLFMVWLAAAVAALGASNSELAEVKTVYLMPMANGLDQFLAVRLTAGSVVQVVTDPQKADAIFTDRIGAALEQKFDELYGEKPKSGDKDKDKDQWSSSKNTMQPLSRGRGAIFLVDRKNRNVIWSMYERPKNSTADEMHHVADRIASRLDKDRKGK
jgi:hypothetical protein